MILLALAVVFFLVLLNGVFSMSELAVVSARRARLQTYADRGDKGAKLALAMAEHPTRFLSAVQVGITLIGILAGAYGQATIAGALDLWLEPMPVVGPHSEIIATIVVVIGLTYVSVILGELVPKRLALLFPDAIARRMAPFSLADTPEEILAEIRSCRYSRIVVATDDDLDGDIGVVLKKDLLDAALSGGPIDVLAHVQQPIAIPETMSLLRAMALFKQTPLHMALVVDEFGSVQGVITPIDLLEMIAGDFPESHDDTETRILRREDGSWLVDARLDIQDLNDALGEAFEAEGGYHTVAGLILDRLGRIPREGEIVELGGFDVEIVDMDGSRIDKVILKPCLRRKADGE
ncbi:MAG: hypothetical protein B7Y81_05725 [Caulobacter sp. 32-67-35]|nr:MAG: hypothetical protein B7Y81_05725 [Caulobacter sp. 32-67-35]